MKIDFTKPITTLDGKALSGSDGQPLVSKTVVSNTLCLSKPKKTEDVIKQFDLALKIFNSTGEIELDEASVKIIKDAMSSSELSTLILGQILKMFA